MKDEKAVKKLKHQSAEAKNDGKTSKKAESTKVAKSMKKVQKRKTRKWKPKKHKKALEESSKEPKTKS